MDETTRIDSIEQLATKLGDEWLAIQKARAACRDHTSKIRDLVRGLKPSSNTSIVAFGSLAREEWTSGSDVDWTLMVDGPADMRHFEVAKSVEEALQSAGYKEPGQTGTFGAMSSSHELVHYIGGLEDTNQNITRRILLVLESISLSDQVTHERVIRAILERYILGDLPTTRRLQYRVPLFLFNDIVRFWRTLAVDYATKKWQRSNSGWAIRNMKLRMSRKLLFAKGILVCFLCDEGFAGKPSSNDSEIVGMELLEKCFQLARRPAIELLADVLDKFADDAVARKTMSAYNLFLASLDDQEKRERLNQLDFGEEDDPLFVELRENSRIFRDGLEQLFFNSHDRLTELIKRYGVF